MLRWVKKIKRLTYVLIDNLCVICAFLIANYIFKDMLYKTLAVSSLEMIGFLTISVFMYIGILYVSGIYENTIEARGRLSFKVIVKMVLDFSFATVFTASTLYFMHVELSRLFYLIFVGTLGTLVFINRYFLMMTQYSCDYKDKKVKNILVVGHSKKGEAYIRQIKDYQYLNIKVMGYISIKEKQKYLGVDYLGNINQLSQIIDNYVIDEIAVARPLAYDLRLKPAINQCQERGITITMLLDIKNTDHTKASAAMIGKIPVLKLHTVSLNENQIFMKRVLDVFGALVGMLIFGCFYILLGPLIKIETPGPIIFKQNRVGKNGRIFKVWKFRSMGVNAEAQKATLVANNEMCGHMFKMTDDPRITRIGAFIRKTSIDELPQFYNVLTGDMSLVGTRPPTVDEVAQYEAHHHKRIAITPGITGNWQVSGRSDILDFEEVVRLDSDYIANWSVWLDIKILIKTIVVVLTKKGSK